MNQVNSANKHRRGRPSNFSVGAKVWLSTRNLAVIANRARKLTPAYCGPFFISRAFPETDTYELDLPERYTRRGLHKKFHSSLLKPFVESDEQQFPNRIVDSVPIFPLDELAEVTFATGMDTTMGDATGLTPIAQTTDESVDVQLQHMQTALREKIRNEKIKIGPVKDHRRSEDGQLEFLMQQDVGRAPQWMLAVPWALEIYKEIGQEEGEKVEDHWISYWNHMKRTLQLSVDASFDALTNENNKVGRTRNCSLPEADNPTELPSRSRAHGQSASPPGSRQTSQESVGPQARPQQTGQRRSGRLAQLPA